MKARSRQADAAGVALFPFLAVLLCTMGSLIIVLVVIARNVRVAERQRQNAAAEVHDDLELKIETAAWRIEQLRAAREKTLAQLAEQRSELSHLEQHTRQLQDDLQRQDAALQALEQELERGAGTLEQQRAELARTEELIRREEQQLERLVEERKKRRPAYAIVPYEGPNGTRRRPIYVECLGDRVVIQPEGVVFRESDFIGNFGPTNALAAALRAAREYLGRRHPAAVAEDGEPYPLLLVRPDGIGAYYAARQAMSSWGTEFGYEFIDVDWPLKLPPADPTLAALMNRAVEEARRRQVTIAMAAPGLLTSEQRLALAAMAREQWGDGDGGDAGGGGWGTGGGGGWGTGATNSQPSQPGASPTGAFASGQSGATGTGAPGQWSPDNAAALAGAPGTTASGMHGADGQPAQFGGGPTFQAGNDAASGAGPFGSPNQPGSSTSGGTSADGGPVRGAAGSRAMDSSHGSGTSGHMAGGPATAYAGASGSGTSASGQPGSSGPMGAVSSQSVSVSLNPNPDPMQRQVDLTIQPLARSRGANWGLPEASRHGAVSVTRPIQVECHADRLVLRGEGRGEQVVDIAGDTSSAVDELIRKIHDRIDSWGIAGNGMVWRPILVMSVASDGARRYADLRVLLEGSGLEMRETTVLLPAQPAARPVIRR